MSAYLCRDCGTADQSLFYTKTKYYCKSCWNRKTYKSSRDKLDLLISERGGACERCGYNKCFQALQWHHIDPNEKEFGISGRRGSPLAELREEVAKCQLLCANCHAEVHTELLPNPTARERKMVGLVGIEPTLNRL
ncbi:HNHc domain containing protein [uncultured Caudovirales phage]|uniref:HNHc domain containing protein n=1 Tax=uncultured Caudovirales phage TaxID=2100421 RepID=A0A6J5KXM6_9CAUD|nr:HNHc domain containing protein [uncultured Caudovirales phage]CAB5209346.1 HNHc domain containing protein [uncultured Caudovirales phage]